MHINFDCVLHGTLTNVLYYYNNMEVNDKNTRGDSPTLRDPSVVETSSTYESEDSYEPPLDFEGVQDELYEYEYRYTYDRCLDKFDDSSESDYVTDAASEESDDEDI
jgi:hypothetical protein